MEINIAGAIPGTGPLGAVDFMYTDGTGAENLGPPGDFPKEEGRLDIRERGIDGGGNAQGKSQRQMRTCSTKH